MKTSVKTFAALVTRSRNLVLPSLLSASLLIPAAAVAQAPQRIKWACIGNSLTEGYPQASLTYVQGANRLSGRIGLQDTLFNAGVSGATLLKRGDKPYWTQSRFAQVFAWQPDIISIELGTNDTKPQNWQYAEDFVADLTALVDTLSTMASKPDIWLMLPPPIFANSFGINDSIMTYGVIPRIQQVAAAKGLKILDANTRMRVIATGAPATYFSDGVHFTARGADSVAAILYRGFLAQVIRVFCIGNSITEGSTLSNARATAYPVRLNMHLGRRYYVRNGGVGGTYMQKAGPSPYWNTAQWRDVFAYRPHLVTIALGTNDSRTLQWNTARFQADYRKMIDTLKATITPAPKIWLLKSMPAWQVNNTWVFSHPSGSTNNGINGFFIRDSVGPAIQQVAEEKGLDTIDFYRPMLMGQPYVHNVVPSHTPDAVHPRERGHDTLAAVLYRGMLPGLPTSLRGRGHARAGSSRNTWNTQGRARLVPVLSPARGSGMSNARLFSLDGKAIPLSPAAGKIAPGIYLQKDAAPAASSHTAATPAQDKD